MRAHPHEVALMVLSGNYDSDQFPSPEDGWTREDARQFLCDLSGVDFGFDHEKWRRWFDEVCSDPEIRELLYDEYFEREKKKLHDGET